MTTDASSQGSVIKGTLAHEFQHMIYFDQHYNRGVASTYAWLNEALSQAAEYYNGYVDNHEGHISNFLCGDPSVNWVGLSLTYWTDYNYGYGAVFIRYLIDQYGDAAIKNMCSTNKVGIAAVEAATGTEFNSIFYNFSIALAISGTVDSSNPDYNSKYDFKTLDLQSVQTVGRPGLNPSTSSATITAGDYRTSSSFPYGIFFIEGIGNFGTMSVTGTEIVGTAFGLSQ